MYEQAFGQRRVGAAEAVEQKRFAAERAGSGKADTPGQQRIHQKAYGVDLPPRSDPAHVPK